MYLRKKAELELDFPWIGTWQSMQNKQNKTKPKESVDKQRDRLDLKRMRTSSWKFHWIKGVLLKRIYSILSKAFVTHQFWSIGRTTENK